VVEERRERILAADAQSKSGGPEKYSEDVDVLRLPSDLAVDAVLQRENLRHQLTIRLDCLAGERRQFSERRHAVPPM
jgi:acetyl-CoA carboxylase carboxyltransferase component